MIKFTINPDKAFNAVLYVIEKAGGRINKYNLLKVIFEADKYHLNKYARPVTGDRYVKMEFGTVPSMIYDLVKVNPITQAIGNIPLKRQQHDIISATPPDLELFSESDIEALDAGFSKYGSLPFGEVKRINHEEKCWKEGTLNKTIPFDEIIENEEVLAYLRDNPFKIAI